MDSGRIASSEKSSQIAGILDAIHGDQGRGQEIPPIQKFPELQERKRQKGGIHSLVDEIRSHPVQGGPGDEIHRNGGFPGSFQNLSPARIRTGIFFQVKSGNSAWLAPDQLENRMKAANSGGRL